MPVIFHVVFLLPYAMAVALWGRHIQWMQTAPDYMLPVMLFMLRRHQYTSSLIISFLTGLAADIITSQSWALHGTFFAIAHILLCRLQIARFMNRASALVAMAFICALFLYIWDVLFRQAPFALGRIFASSLLTALASLLLFYFFSLIRLGWGTASSDRDAPLLNG